MTLLRRRMQLVGAWSGLGALLMVMLGIWGFAGFIPLHDPGFDAYTIASIYRDNPVSIRFGMIVLMFGAMLFLPFAAALTDQISEFEGRTGPLSLLAALGGFSLAM